VNAPGAPLWAGRATVSNTNLCWTHGPRVLPADSLRAPTHGRPTCPAFRILHRSSSQADEAGLAAGWAQLEGLSGKLLTVGRPTVAARGKYRVVDIPLAFERGPMKARVSFDSEGRIAGLFVLYPDLP